MKTVTLRLEDDVKEQLDCMLEKMGMNIATFYNIYTMKSLREKRIPFEITAPEDPFYSESNMERIKQSVKQVEKGKVIVKSMEELDDMALGWYSILWKCFWRVSVLADTGQENSKKDKFIKNIFNTNKDA